MLLPWDRPPSHGGATLLLAVLFDIAAAATLDGGSHGGIGSPPRVAGSAAPQETPLHKEREPESNTTGTGKALGTIPLMRAEKEPEQGSGARMQRISGADGVEAHFVQAFTAPAQHPTPASSQPPSRSKHDATGGGERSPPRPRSAHRSPAYRRPPEMEVDDSFGFPVPPPDDIDDEIEYEEPAYDEEVTNVVEVGHGQPLQGAAPPWEALLRGQEAAAAEGNRRATPATTASTAQDGGLSAGGRGTDPVTARGQGGSNESGSERAQELARLLGEGVGTETYDPTSPTRSRSLNQEFRLRLQIQDRMTFIVLVIVFFTTLLATLCAVYHLADDRSPVVFYTDPKHDRQRVCCEAGDQESFLDSFVHNQPPAVTRLRIIGKQTQGPDLGALLGNFRFKQVAWHVHNAVYESLQRAMLPTRPRVQAGGQEVIFDVSLDLTPFIISSRGDQHAAASGAGALADDLDLQVLQEHLRSKNPLQLLLLRKTVKWEGWEDMATNIRQRLRSLGFAGDVEVLLDASEELIVFRNDRWQNFARSWITTALVYMSLIGPALWFPYIWARKKQVQVRAQYHIALDLRRYWELLSEGLNGNVGFEVH